MDIDQLIITLVNFFIILFWVMGLVSWFICIYSVYGVWKHVKQEKKWHLSFNPLSLFMPRLYTEEGNKHRKRLILSALFFISCVFAGFISGLTRDIISEKINKIDDQRKIIKDHTLNKADEPDGENDAVLG